MRELFNVRLLAALIVAGIVAFGAFLVFSAYADDFRSGSDGRGHALSVSAVGFQGIVRLVDSAGGKSRLLRSDAAVYDDDLLVIVLEPQTNPKTLENLLARRPDQPTLIVLPKWLAAPDPQHRGWVRVAGHGFDPPALAAIRNVRLSAAKGDARPMARGSGLLEGISVRAPREAHMVAGDGLVPLLKMDGGGALVAQVEDEPLYLLADPDLMNNQGLKDPATARAALAILARLNSPDADSVVFDVTLNGFGRKPSAFKLAFEPPFVTLTLALFVAALLAGLHGAFRFGPAAHEKRAIAFGKLALVENSAGLIQLARREHKVGAAYADVVRDSAAHAAAAPATLQGEALEAYLDRLSARNGLSFSSLARQAREATDRYDLLRAARALFQWKKDTIR